jgi:hypothetical protein
MGLEFGTLLHNVKALEKTVIVNQKFKNTKYVK